MQCDRTTRESLTNKSQQQQHTDADAPAADGRL